MSHNNRNGISRRSQPVLRNEGGYTGYQQFSIDMKAITIFNGSRKNGNMHPGKRCGFLANWLDGSSSSYFRYERSLFSMVINQFYTVDVVVLNIYAFKVAISKNIVSLINQIKYIA